MHRFAAYSFIVLCLTMKVSGYPFYNMPQVPEKFRQEHEELYKKTWLPPSQKLDLFGDHFRGEW